MTVINLLLIKRFHSAIALANPSSLHPLDEQRFHDFFAACREAGVTLTGASLDEIWPENTISGLGGDPAHSEKLKDSVYDLFHEWEKNSNQRF